MQSYELSRRGALAIGLHLLSAPSWAQEVDIKARISKLVRLIEGRYVPRGKEPTPTVALNFIANRANPEYPFVVLSSLDLIEGSLREPRGLTILNLNAVDDFIAGRAGGNWGQLGPFEYLCNFAFSEASHDAVFAELKQTACEAAQIALLATLRLAPLTAASASVLSQYALASSVNVRLASLIGLVTRPSRPPTLNWKKETRDSILGTASRLLESRFLDVNAAKLLLLALSAVPFLLDPAAAPLKKAVLNKASPAAPNDPVLRHFGAR